MPVTVQEWSSQQILATKDGRGWDLVTETGVAVFNFIGSGRDWRRDAVVIPTRSVWFPGGEILSSSQGPEGKAPGPHAIGTAALASISNSRTAVDAGWASDDARVEFDSKTRRFNLIVGLAVRDSDGYVHRVAYTVTMLGVLMPR